MQTDPNAPVASLIETIGQQLANRAKQGKIDKIGLARLANLNRNTVTSALSGKDIKLSTLIRISRVLGHIDWLLPLLETPAATPLEQLARQGTKSRRRQTQDSTAPAPIELGRKKPR